MADVKKTADEREKEIVEWKNEDLHEVLEELSKLKDVETKSFINCILEYNNRPQYSLIVEKADEEDPEKKKEKKRKEEEEKKRETEEQLAEIKSKLRSSKKTMTLLEFMEYILAEIEVEDDEAEIIKAFEIFDRYRHTEIVVGTVPLSDFKYIMEQLGPLGYQLNDYEQAKFWRLLKDEFEYLNHIKTKVDYPTVEVIEYVQGTRHVNFVKDKEIDYIAFTKKLMQSVAVKDKKFKEMKEKEEGQNTIIDIS